MFGYTRGLIFTGTFAVAAGGYLLFSASGFQAMSLEVLLLPRGRPLIDGDAFWVFFTSLFAIMNPLIAIPYIVSLSDGGSPASRKRLARVTTFAVLLALLVAALLGRDVLGLFAISIGSFRIAGGIIVLLMGLALLRSDGASVAASGAASRTGTRQYEAICPLAIPLLAGPGAIATVIIHCEDATGPSDFFTIAAVIVLMVAIIYGILRVATPLAKLLGPAGLTVMTRLIGMIIAAIAVDMLVIGLWMQFPALTE